MAGNPQFATRNSQFLFVVLALCLLAACSVAGAPEVTPAPAAALSAPGNGYLAYIGMDGNVYVTIAEPQPHSPWPLQLTADATTRPEGNGRSYQQLAWSPDGRLAFAAVERALGQTRSQLFVSGTAGGPAQLVGESDEHFVIYMHWAPDGQRLAYLIAEADSIALHLVETGSEAENRRLGLGRPHYFGWSPDSQRILAHTGGALRYNRSARLTLHDLETGAVTTLSQPTGMFLAPEFAPDGRRWLAATAEAGSDRLQVFGGEATLHLAETADNFVVGAWAPDGRRIAFSVRSQHDYPFFEPIHLMDLESGQVERLTGVSFYILAFFWSPDGERLAYLTWLHLPESTAMQWRVLELTTGQDRGYAVFRASPQMQFMVSSFNQYAQSHRLWSPDGRYLVFADQDNAEVERVWLVDTHNDADRRPILVAEGTIGVWSFGSELALAMCPDKDGGRNAGDADRTLIGADSC